MPYISLNMWAPYNISMKFTVFCCVCGKSVVADSENFAKLHLLMRDHVRLYHQDDKVDMFGNEIKRGYAWTDFYVGVNKLKGVN
jgi:hypothetical protein